MQEVILFQIIQKILPKLDQRASSVIITPSPEQWTGGNINQIHKA